MAKTPGSGRKKGTPNKATQSARDTLARLKLDPLEEMIKIYLGEILFEQAVEIQKKDGKKEFLMMPACEQTRIQCLRECLKRQHPELRAVEITGEDGPLEIVIRTTKSNGAAK